MSTRTTLLIVFTVIGGCVVVCGGAAFYVWGTITDVRNSGTSFVIDTLRAAGPEWDGDALMRASAPALRAQPRAALDHLTQRGRAELGMLIDATPGAFRASTANGATYLAMQLDARFQRGRCQVDVQLVRSGATWQLLSLYVHFPPQPSTAPAAGNDGP